MLSIQTTRRRTVNVVTLIGNLASDVELKQVGEDKQVASFLLAVDRPSAGGGADFVRVAAWNKQAEACERFLGKGKRVAIDGRLRSRSWEEEGKRRSAIEVVANNVQFLTPPEGRDTEAAEAFEAAAAG
jgi:single-strand DNA-binding protein